MFALFVGSCDIEKEPKPLDKGPYVGCYVDGPLRMKLSDNELSINGRSFPYVVQFRKVGYIVSSHFIVEGSGSNIRITPSQDETFYRIISSDGVPSIVVTDGESRVYTLKRQSFC